MELQEEEEEEEEGKAGCSLLLPPLTGQRSICTYLTLPTSSRTCDYPYRLQKLREGGILRLSSSNYMVTHRHHLFSLHTSYPRTKSLIIPNIKLSPHLSTKARAKPSKQKNRRSASPKYNKKNWAQPRHRSYNIPSHPTVPPPTPLLSSPTKKRPLLFSETGKGKTLACLQGWKKKLLPVWP